MGRKQKLRQEKRNIKNKTAAAAEVTAAAADDVKEKIFEKTGIPKKNQRLNFNRQPLLEKDDNKTLNDCGIKHDDILDLQPMEITVKAPDGRTTKLVVSPEDTIDDIKLQVNEKLAIPFVDQRPTFKGKALPEKSTLRSNNIGHGDTINLQPMEITVVAPDGRAINLVVSPDATIDYVKRQVNKRLKEKETVEVVEKAEALMNQFPKSDMYFQAMAGQDTDNISAREQYELLKEGATEDGCIHCMFRMGKMTMYTPDGKCMQIHLALPWFLEGAIRGSFPCMMSLMSECYYFKDEPNREKKNRCIGGLLGENHQAE